MKLRTMALTVLLIAAALLTTLEAQTRRRETLLEAVRRVNGPIALGQAPPNLARTSFEDLVKASDLIVQGTLAEPVTYLAEEGTTLYTDYRIGNPEVFVGTMTTSPAPTFAPTEITLTQLGGTTILEGHQVTVGHLALAPLKPGMEGIFFLTRRDGRTFLVASYFGAYELRAGLIYPLGDLANIAGDVRGNTLTQFRTKIARILEQLSR